MSRNGMAATCLARDGVNVGVRAVVPQETTT